MKPDFLSPLVLAVDPFTIAGNGSVATPKNDQLINPNKTPMLIDELRFNVGNDDNNVEFTTIQANIQFGSTPITNNFVPLRSIVPLYFSADANRTLTWHFARPLFVPPDVQFTVSFKRKLPAPVTGWSNLIDTTNLWGFSIVGRSMPDGMAPPEKIYVPWACATSVYDDGVSQFVSGDADIGNPHDEVLNVDYFCGWNTNSDNVSNMLRQPFTFQATMGHNKVLARDPIPFLALFPPDRPILRCRALLQPKEFISVQMEIPQTSADQDGLSFTTVGMTGWRELQTPKGAYHP